MIQLVGDLTVSRETYDKLRHFESLVLKWSKTINLISRDSATQIWERHILDSVQLFNHVSREPATWLDIGSGGGFPGIVSAIMLSEIAPQSHVTLVESDARKSVFLRTALRECDVSGAVYADRIEAISPQNATILTARALASVGILLSAAEKHLNPQGTAYFHKGRSAADEVEEAQKMWSFDCIAHQSLTASEAAILEIRNIRRAQS